MKTFIAINMNDFHANQNGEAKTTVEMRFIGADSLESASNIVRNEYPNVAWSVFGKPVLDKNIVYRRNNET